MNKYLYRHKYINKPLEENTVMFETFMGKVMQIHLNIFMNI